GIAELSPGVPALVPGHADGDARRGRLGAATNAPPGGAAPARVRLSRALLGAERAAVRNRSGAHSGLGAGGAADSGESLAQVLPTSSGLPGAPQSDDGGAGSPAGRPPVVSGSPGGHLPVR